MIVIQNRQRTIPLKTQKYKPAIEKIVEKLGYSDFDVTIRFVSNNVIQKYNKTYRNKDKPTNVLSFPYYPNANPNEKIAPLTPEDRILGDILIAPLIAQQEAVEQGKTLDNYILLLIVHAICHLIGHDHEQDDEYQKMNALEQQLLASISTLL